MMETTTSNTAGCNLDWYEQNQDRFATADPELMQHFKNVVAAYKEQSELLLSLKQQLEENKSAAEWRRKHKTANADKARRFYTRNQARVVERQRGRDRMKAEFKRFCAIDIM